MSADQEARLLPPLLGELREHLAEHGPMSVDEATAWLRTQGRRIAPDRLHATVVKHPKIFGTDGERIWPFIAEVDDAEQTPPDEPPAWQRFPQPGVLEREQVVVIDIETTGLDPESDLIWELAAVNLETNESLSVVVRWQDRDRIQELPDDVELLEWSEALQRFSTFIGKHQAIAGQNLTSFDLPFLTQACRRHGGAFSPPPTLELLRLATVFDPAATGHSLFDLCERYSVDNPEPHRALSDAQATAAIIRHILDGVDPQHPNWAVAISCLAHAGDAWASLFPVPVMPQLEEALIPAADPLLEAGSSSRTGVTAKRLRAAFDILHDHGLAERAGQRDMAAEVAATLDRGQRLAVEAPTGTGKSFVYLLPAAAWSAANERPTVVATYTKAVRGHEAVAGLR